MFRVDLTGWYFDADGALRACVVVNVNGNLGVIDAETLKPVSVKPDDVLIERPEA